MQKFFIVSKLGIYAVSQTLMKSHWRFQRPGGMPVSSWLFCSTNKHTWISTIILYTKLTTVFPIENFQLNHALAPWNRSDQLLFYTELCPEGLAMEDLPKPMLCREAAPTSLPITPMSALRIFPDPGDNNELIFIIIPPWVAVPLPNPMLVWNICGWRVRKQVSLISLFSIYVLLFLCTVSGVTLWGADEWNLPKDGRGTVDSRVIITSGRQLKDSCNSTHNTGPEATTKDILLSITLPRQCGSQSVLVNWTSLGSVLHSAGLTGGEDTLSH